MGSIDTNGVHVEGVTDTIGVVVPDPTTSVKDTHPIFTMDDVLPHRQNSEPMNFGVAAFASSKMFRSKASFNKPQSKRWDHRITQESASRHGSSLKGAMKFMRPGMISLGGGLPAA